MGYLDSDKTKINFDKIAANWRVLIQVPLELAERCKSRLATISPELGIFPVISAFCGTPVAQNAEITWKNPSSALIYQGVIS